MEDHLQVQNLSNTGFAGALFLAQPTTPGDSPKPAVPKPVSAASQGRHAELKEAAREFEALFVAYLLKVMRETIEESGLADGGLGRGVYTELFDQEVARAVALRSPLGISDTILRGLSRDREITPASRSQDTRERRDEAGLRGIPAAGRPAPAVDIGGEVPDFRLPVQAPVSSVFGTRVDPFDGRLRFHRGIDLAAPVGTAVCAALGGRVVHAGHEDGYGNTVMIEHGDELRTRYAHLGTISVKTGETVGNRERIGSVGNTGRSTGPHLHFEVVRLGKAVDPADLMIE